MKTERDYKVRAIHCSHRASVEEIYERLKEITAPLDRAWEKIEKAQKIVVKANMQMRTDNIRRIAGRRQELVDDDVLSASLRLLKERSEEPRLHGHHPVSKKPVWSTSDPTFR